MTATFRDYATADELVQEIYRKQRTYQTVDFVRRVSQKYQPQIDTGCSMPIWDCFDLLTNFIDISDPDISLPNIHHLFQTANAIRADGHPDWFQLVGLIHDLGKIIYLNGCPEDGTSLTEQWAIVGDTFIVGCQLPEESIYPEFNKLNPDSDNPKYNTKYGMYTENCGLNNCLMAYGHDEYLYQILVANKVKLPPLALAIIRYHSLYPWHKHGAYRHLMAPADYETLKWVQLFNQYDLYSKENQPMDIATLRDYYQPLVQKYLGTILFF